MNRAITGPVVVDKMIDVVYNEISKTVVFVMGILNLGVKKCPAVTILRAN